MGYRPESRLKKDHLGLEPGRQSPPLWGTSCDRARRVSKMSLMQVTVPANCRPGQLLQIQDHSQSPLNTDEQTEFF